MAATLVEVDVAGVGGLVPARGVRGWLMEGKLFHPKIVATTYYCGGTGVELSRSAIGIWVVLRSWERK